MSPGFHTPGSREKVGEKQHINQTQREHLAARRVILRQEFSSESLLDMQSLRPLTILLNQKLHLNKIRRW